MILERPIRIAMILAIASPALAGNICYSGFLEEMTNSLGQTDYPLSVEMSLGKIAIGSGSAENAIGAVAIVEWVESGNACDAILGTWEREQVLWGQSAGDEFGHAIAFQTNNLASIAPNAGESGLLSVYLSTGVNEEDFWQLDATFQPSPGYSFTGQLEMALPWMVAAEQNAQNGMNLRIFKRDATGWSDSDSIGLGQVSNAIDLSLTSTTLAVGTPEVTFDNKYNEQGGIWVWKVDEGANWVFGNKVSPVAQEAFLHAGQQVAAYGDYLAYSTGGLDTPHPSSVEIQVYDSGTETWAPFNPPGGNPRGDALGNVIDELVMTAQGLYLSVADTVTGESAIGLIEFIDGYVLTEISRADVADSTRSFDFAVEGHYVIAEGVESGPQNRSVWLVPTRDCNANGEDDVCDLCRFAGWDGNENGSIDFCECPGNVFDEDPANPTVNEVDVVFIIDFLWGDDDGYGDCNTDGITDVLDLLMVLENWGSCS
ncbi:MAG: hypothetical protein P8I91_02885 [Phycisphaerales bacterium]|nr:hypothetical protein [Phycisphaerales bacterium]